jgi:hypothetical protein
VWVKLYYVDGTQTGAAFKIKPVPDEVDGLKDAVKKKCADDLNGVTPANLNVYAVGDYPETADERLLDPGDPVPTGTSSKNALIVVAQTPRQQHDGKLRCCCCCSRILVFNVIFEYGNTSLLVFNTYVIIRRPTCTSYRFGSRYKA